MNRKFPKRTHTPNRSWPHTKPFYKNTPKHTRTPAEPTRTYHTHTQMPSKEGCLRKYPFTFKHPCASVCVCVMCVSTVSNTHFSPPPVTLSDCRSVDSNFSGVACSCKTANEPLRLEGYNFSPEKLTSGKLKTFENFTLRAEVAAHTHTFTHTIPSGES